MIIRPLLMFTVLSAGTICAVAQKEESSVPHTMNLQQAVELALEHNHDVRISLLKVQENEHAREAARSAYLPVLKNDTSFFHLTDTQFIEIPAGSLGSAGSSPIPPRDHILNQGGHDIFTSGTSLSQPLTELFKIRAANDVVLAEVKASRSKARGVRNQIELKVRQLYCQILIVESQHRAIEATIRASEDLQTERLQQVKYGSTLESDLIESRAQSLEAKQELLTSELQLSDLHMQFNDIVGLPINSELSLDAEVSTPGESCTRAECIKVAFDSNPEIAEARAALEKASAGVREAKREYIPDVEAIARYSHQNSSVPFLAPDFGTFGVHASYDIFDGGKKRATLRERDSQLGQAKENLARITDEIQVKVLTAYNKLERTEQMVAVSQQLLAARKEAWRVSAQGLERGTYLRSQAEAAAAQESKAQTQLLQSQLEYAQAQDELNEAIGRTAND